MPNSASDENAISAVRTLSVPSTKAAKLTSATSGGPAFISVELKAFTTATRHLADSSFSRSSWIWTNRVEGSKAGGLGV